MSVGEMAAEMDKVLRALTAACVHVAGLDQADQARQLADRVSYSPLRTALEHGVESAERVTNFLREQSRT